MILELDCGNSLIKWRLLAAGAEVVETGIVDSDDALIAALSQPDSPALAACRLVSVRSDEETQQLKERLTATFGIACHQALPVEVWNGVRNGYRDHQRLGMDRWLVILAAVQLAEGKACVVLDLGTAVTADLVDAQGEHQGGFICPGIPLMRRELQTHTRRIRYDPHWASGERYEAPGRTTIEAVERGCLYMLKGFVRTQYELAQEMFAEGCEIFLTGVTRNWSNMSFRVRGSCPIWCLLDWLWRVRSRTNDALVVSAIGGTERFLLHMAPTAGAVAG